jgi:hypothetical protein
VVPVFFIEKNIYLCGVMMLMLWIATVGVLTVVGMGIVIYVNRDVLFGKKNIA